MTDIPSQVIRIRVAGPSPFNTLVVVRSTWMDQGSGSLSSSPGLHRNQLKFDTPFVLYGFDPRVPPVYTHSTTVALGQCALGDDTSFTMAVDAVRAGFEDDGRWIVIADTTLSIDNPLYAFLGPVVTSWVLCHEPPPSPPPEGWARAATPAEAFRGIFTR